MGFKLEWSDSKYNLRGRKRPADPTREKREGSRKKRNEKKKKSPSQSEDRTHCKNLISYVSQEYLELSLYRIDRALDKESVKVKIF